MKPADNPRERRVPTAELQSALEDLLCDHFGVPSRIVALERHPSAYRTSFAIEELDVSLGDGANLALIFKDLCRKAMTGKARAAKPEFLYDPLREIGTYERILPLHRMGTPTCYGTVIDERRDRFWLFLERVAGRALYQVGDFAVWREVARWLAAMHRHFAQEIHPLMQAPSVPLLRYDGDYYWLWLQRARTFLRGHVSTGGTCPDMEWLAGRYHLVVERLLALPVTFIHGEFYASNILVQEAADNLRVCPVDWEMAAIGPGLLDLAALTAGKWTGEQKSFLAHAYYSGLYPEGSGAETWDAFRTSLDYCYLHVALQWLGWSRRWTPPRDHAQDWLHEVVRLSEKLQL